MTIPKIIKECCYEYCGQNTELKKNKGISQEELADKVGVSRQAVSKWESEQSVPDLDRVIIMSEYFGGYNRLYSKGD